MITAPHPAVTLRKDQAAMLARDADLLTRAGGRESQLVNRNWTQWWIKYPWHVSGTAESGNVPTTCSCGCREEWKGYDKQAQIYEISTREAST